MQLRVSCLLRTPITVSRLRLQKQPPLRGAVVRRRQLAGDTPVEVLGLGLGLLVYDNVRRIGLLPRGAHAKRLHRVTEIGALAPSQPISILHREISWISSG